MNRFDQETECNAVFQPAAMRVIQALTPVMRSRLGIWVLGFLFWMSNLLFWLLVVSLKWWHLAWPPPVRASLFTILAFTALTACLFLAFFSIMLVWWRLQSDSFVPNLKTAQLLFSYTLLPMIYGVIGVWGIRQKSGYNSPNLIWGVALLYLAYSVGILGFAVAKNLKLLRKAKV